MKNKSTYTILVFLICLVEGFAQNIEITSVPFPSTFSPSLAVGMTQDNLGNIWIATSSEGLLKYNGQSFTSFNSERNNPNSLISDRLECIHADQNGFVWIGSFGNGLSKYDPSTEIFTNYLHDESDPKSIRSNAIRTFAEDGNGGIWIGTATGIDYWNPKTQLFEHDFQVSPDAEILQEEHVRELYMDRSGTIWAGTSSPFYGEETKGGLFKIDPKTRSVKRYIQGSNPNSLGHNSVTAIFEDSRGTFWIGTAEDGLHTMDRELGTFRRHTYDPSDPTKLSRPDAIGLVFAMDHIKFFEEDMYGRIWIGTMNNGVNLYDPNTNSIHHLNSNRMDDYRLPQNALWASLKTKDDFLWITGWGPTENDDILFKVDLDPVKINHFDNNAPVFSFAEGRDGHIYMGSENFLYRVDENDEIVNALNLTGSEIISLNHINEDANGNLWISTEHGLLFFNTTTEEHKLYPLHDSGMFFGALLEILLTDDISPDSILVGSINGLYLFDVETEEFSLIPYEYKKTNDRALPMSVEALHIDSRKNMWLGFGGLGLLKLAPDYKTYKEYPFLENIQDNPQIIYEDDYQNLYVGNWRSGLRKYDYASDTFEHLMDNTGRIKRESGITDLYAVNDSVLFVLSAQGPLQYNVLSNVAANIQMEEINKYDIESDRMFVSSTNDFYLGTSYGYLKFKPEEFQRNVKYQPEPTISKILVGDRNLTSETKDHSEKYNLEYNDNSISFVLNYISYFNSTDERELEYILENHDQHWRGGRNEEEVYYFKLPPGSYNFRVRAQDSLGEWSEDSFTFKIHPPWWLTWWAYMSYGLILMLGAWYVHKTQKEKTIRRERELLREKELAHAKEIEKAYTDLKATQAQLIQSEKMASLGELTAGIAHEIQNPLNFVNNFSDVSNELLDEVKEEIENENKPDALEIINDVKQNLEKITYHGERASGIVKAMLDHSRVNSGERVLADINALADEFLRLSYHGLRAKDSSFNAKYTSTLDEDLPKVKVAPQDIGRVILNLINNAFYAVNDKKSQLDGTYSPEVKLSTYSGNGSIHVIVEDNGNGISGDMKTKIFQPFFTTKPTGQGTGLGLSLAYDIVKAHGGELRVESEEGKGSKFMIELPLFGNTGYKNQSLEEI